MTSWIAEKSNELESKTFKLSKDAVKGVIQISGENKELVVSRYTYNNFVIFKTLDYDSKKYHQLIKFLCLIRAFIFVGVVIGLANLIGFTDNVYVGAITGLVVAVYLMLEAYWFKYKQVSSSDVVEELRFETARELKLEPHALDSLSIGKLDSVLQKYVEQDSITEEGHSPTLSIPSTNLVPEL